MGEPDFFHWVLVSSLLFFHYFTRAGQPALENNSELTRNQSQNPVFFNFVPPGYLMKKRRRIEKIRDRVTFDVEKSWSHEPKWPAFLNLVGYMVTNFYVSHNFDTSYILILLSNIV